MKDEAMPNYDICYWNPDGSMATQVKAECASDQEAKILAHALKGKGFKRLKVWSNDDKHLVYQRPLIGAANG
jgi:hypothetical protein